jgi:hypothetical protein
MRILIVSVLVFVGQAMNSYAAPAWQHRADTVKLEEFFVDSLHIGKKKFNKVEVSRFGSSDSFFVVIKFYSRSGNTWNLKQTFNFPKDDIIGCDPKLSDFNNDGFKDLTYVSDVAARGANEVRRLFIYDKVKDRLICMKNSEDYPNMRYNKTLHCIDAFLVYGGCSTVFLRIKGDKLVEFASVDLDDGLTVYEIDGKGHRKLIRHEAKTKMLYVRFTNYKPLTPYYTD